MGRRWKSRQEESDSDGDDGGGKSVVFLSGSDDEEANEDLSLEIVNKAKQREAKRKRDDEEERVRAFFLDLPSADQLEAVSNGKGVGVRDEVAAPAASEEDKKKREKRMKKKKKEVSEATGTELPDAYAKEEEPIGNAESVVAIIDEASNNIVLRKLLRGPRYFDPGDGNWETCYNCGKEGHTATNCTEEKRQKPCFVCGMFGHNPKQCVQGHDCFKCNRRGHQAKDCPDKLKTNIQVSILCLRCGDLGHDMASCRNDYAPYDLKEIQCYICKKNGHLCCIDYKDNGSRELSCYNCAESGHTGQGCAKLRGEIHSAGPPTLCYRCGEEGHFARGCTKSPKSGWRPGEFSTPARWFKDKKEARSSRSLPRDFGREKKKNKVVFEKKCMTAMKSRIKGGWMVEDPVSIPKWKHKANGCSSPSTPAVRRSKFHSASGGHFSSPNMPSKRYSFYAETPFSRGSSSRGSTGSFHPRFSDSRFRNYCGFYD